TLVEKAEAAVDKEEAEEMERRMMKGEFSFDDFLRSYKMLRRMGPLQGVLKMIPGLGSQLEGMENVDERQLARVEGIVLSMTPQERRFPHVIDGSRRQRIAKGSGTSVQQVNQLLEARKQMAKMMKQLGSGKMPALPGQAPVHNGPTRSATKKRKSKRKKRSRGESFGSQAQADRSRVEEEPGLPDRGGGLPLAARRQVPGDRRPLQPADRPVHHRVRRRAGEGLALEGRAAVRDGPAAAQGQGPVS